MTTEANTHTNTHTDHATAVGAIYAAFGRGDVPYILDQLADDIAWEPGIRHTGLPWLQQGSGKAHVGQFFAALGAGMQMTTFEPLMIAQSGDDVVAVIREGATVVATGKAIDDDLYAHLWRFDASGKVTSFRHIGDWHRHEQAAS